VNEQGRGGQSLTGACDVARHLEPQAVPQICSFSSVERTSTSCSKNILQPTDHEQDIKSSARVVTKGGVGVGDSAGVPKWCWHGVSVSCVPAKYISNSSIVCLSEAILYNKTDMMYMSLCEAQERPSAGDAGATF
jgi:hypothetical protein